MTAKLLPIAKTLRQKRLRNTLNAHFQLVRFLSPSSVYFPLSLSISVSRYDAPLVKHYFNLFVFVTCSGAML